MSFTVLKSVWKLYGKFAEDDIRTGKYPAYKASGMAYVRFASEERELFKLLFMRDRSGGEQESTDEIPEIVEYLSKTLGISRDEARFFHLEMWICVHGIATLIATGYRSFDEEMVSEIITDNYRGLKHRTEEKHGK